VMAWFAWTQIARPRTFHVPVYNPPLVALVAALVGIAVLFVWAIRFPPRFTAVSRPPAPLLVGIGAMVWAAFWYALVVLAFGMAPQVSAPLVAAVAVVVVALILAVLPRWAAHGDWSDRHAFSMIFGAVTGSALASSIGFYLSSTPSDFWFKVVFDVLALGLLGRLRPRRPDRRAEAVSS
jgi:hypothetical protein